MDNELFNIIYALLMYIIGFGLGNLYQIALNSDVKKPQKPQVYKDESADFNPDIIDEE